MIVFPNCKINLGLNVIGKRTDGFHDLETVFYPLAFTDVLEIAASENSSNELVITGLQVPAGESNLCMKAYSLLKKDFPHMPFIKIHLHKAIPMGAGLGGGSADAAFSLKLLNKKFINSLTAEQIKRYALQLGSDCPFFIDNIPSFATGRGECLDAVDLHLENYKIMLVNPGIHVDTAWAYSKITPSRPATSIKDIIRQPPQMWVDALTNDFERPVFEEYPEIKQLKKMLYDAGAVYASLTGSGSTVYGLFHKHQSINTSFAGNYFNRVINL